MIRPSGPRSGLIPFQSPTKNSRSVAYILRPTRNIGKLIPQSRQTEIHFVPRDIATRTAINERAIALGWLWRHESGTYLKFTDSARALGRGEGVATTVVGRCANHRHAWCGQGRSCGGMKFIERGEKVLTYSAPPATWA
jgi:hypothetical protein